MIQRILITFVVMLSIARAEISAQLPDSVTGCWTITFTPWQPAVAEFAARLFEPLPDTIQLSDQRFDSSYYRATRRPRIAGTLRGPLADSLNAFWRPLSSDSIDVWLPQGRSIGARTHLWVTGDTLRGRGWLYFDYQPFETPYSDALAVRCGA